MSLRQTDPETQRCARCGGIVEIQGVQNHGAWWQHFDDGAPAGRDCQRVPDLDRLESELERLRDREAELIVALKRALPVVELRAAPLAAELQELVAKREPDGGKKG